ncbi:MAG: tetratricopeptide repeat protein [Bacteroidota bacterium]
MEQTSSPVLYLAYANSSRKKKGSNELKALEKELTTCLQSLSRDGNHIQIVKEGINQAPNGYELLVESFSYTDIQMIHLVSEPSELDGMFLNSIGGKKKTPNWDEVSLEHLPDLRVVFIDGGGSLELVEKFLFAGVPIVIASQYTESSPLKDQALKFREYLMLSLGMGNSIENAFRDISEGIEVELDMMHIPGDPYAYWDFKEAYEEKQTFVWGAYAHAANASLLQEPIFDAPTLQPPVEVVETSAPVPVSEVNEPVIEEEELVLAGKETDQEIPNVPSNSEAEEKPQGLRLRSNTFKQTPASRRLEDVRDVESEGILRKVAYWSQSFSTPKKSAPPSVQKEVLQQPLSPEQEEPVGKVIPFSSISVENELPVVSTSLPSPPSRPSIKGNRKSHGSFHKLFAMVGMGALMLLLGSSLLYNYFKPSKPNTPLALQSAFLGTSTYNVLLLPFFPGNDCNTTNVLNESSVRDHLNSLPESQELGIRVATSDGYVIGCPESSEEAKRIGEVNNAHLVIWGTPGEGTPQGESDLLKIQYVALNQHQDPLAKSHKRIGHQAFGDVYDLQEGLFAGKSKDLVYWVLAVAHLKSEDYAAAINYIDQINMQEQPEFSVLMHMQAKCYQGMERFEDALNAYDEAVFLDPHNPNIYHHRGRLHQQLNHKDLALADYTEAIRLNPKHLKAQYQRKLLLEDLQGDVSNGGVSIQVSSR